MHMHKCDEYCEYFIHDGAGKHTPTKQPYHVDTLIS